ncbi:hypothetical protein CEUSTIGMA_g8704.t1 [Chlamydomonas eustigma]|uniref:Uncharacterized protein n=1 Tax=Chlamydomonas eustigma TaxID=1157962 RepID=A0A250XEE1_9CHLO|nr:hypothetical protein CEUSTIGMA_g8704.t1 [Chlamydomonas eustigma]|eukprot:GAX81272.1 hypothetical protein CEUSTIGMA_g8704.t1 [Chlamydomonas eustigma]
MLTCSPATSTSYQILRRLDVRTCKRCPTSVTHASPRGEWATSLKHAAVAVGSTLIILNPGMALADSVLMVPATQALQMAQPLQKETIDKRKVWTLFIGGAAMLFLGTLAIENTSAFFPAIARANRASADARKAAEEREKQAKMELAEALEVDRQTAVVEQALKEAREKQRLAASTQELQSFTAGPAVNPKPTTNERASQESSSASAAASPVASTTVLEPSFLEGKGSEEAIDAKNARLATFVGNMTGNTINPALGSRSEKAS